MSNLDFMIGKTIGKFEFFEIIEKKLKESGDEAIDFPYHLKKEIIEIYFSNVPSNVKEELISERVFLLNSFLEKVLSKEEKVSNEVFPF